MKNNASKRACIVVLGDIGHSPRMSYHAMSLSREGYEVDIFGYEGSLPHADLIFNPKIDLHHLKKVPNFISGNKHLQISFRDNSSFLLFIFSLPPISLFHPKSIVAILDLILQSIMRSETRFHVDSKPSVDSHDSDLLARVPIA